MYIAAAPVFAVVVLLLVMFSLPHSLLLFLLAPIKAAGEPATTSFDLRAAGDYVKSQYNPSLGLVRENEHIERYWLWSDNELAALALGDHAPAISENITNSVLAYKEAYDIEFRSAYGAILGKDASSFLAPINKNVADKIWYTDHAGDSELQCTDYADIAFLKAIYYYKAGDHEQSAECYQAGQRMFDGTGFKDKSNAEDDDRYSTYKVALWMLAADLTRDGEDGDDEDDDHTESARGILEKMQDEQTGGVYTHYTSNLVPDSQTNVETTTLTMFVFDTSLP